VRRRLHVDGNASIYPAASIECARAERRRVKVIHIRFVIIIMLSASKQQAARIRTHPDLPKAAPSRHTVIINHTD
jgi:hypothetical protein